MTTPNKPKPRKPKPCIVKQHFDCDGSGQKCDTCGESEAACPCDSFEQNLKGFV